MKKNLLILLTGIFILSGCDSKEYEPDNPDNPTGSVELDLINKDSINLWCKSTTSFEAIKDEQYTIESRNPSIVKVCAEGKKFTVRAINPGITDIIITSCSGNKSVLKCLSCTFANTWSETPELAHIYKNTAMVVANDKSIEEKIRSELAIFALNRDYKYVFSEGTNELSVLIPNQEDSVKGTYTWDAQTQTLTLTYENTAERYTCDIQPAYPNFFQYAPRFIIAVKQDLTKEYASQYPNAGIRDVYIIRHIMALRDYWQITRR